MPHASKEPQRSGNKRAPIWNSITNLFANTILMQAQQGVSTSRKICIRLLPSTMKVGALQELLAKEGFECHQQYELLYYVQGSQLLRWYATLMSSSLSHSRCYLSVKEEDTVKRLVKVFDRKSLQNSPRYSCICIWWIEKISVILSPYQMISSSLPNRSSPIEEDPEYQLFLENETVSNEWRVELIEIAIKSWRYRRDTNLIGPSKWWRSCINQILRTSECNNKISKSPFF